ncbi:hypothetical protein pipiens_015070 [Culex pipiens pipiens]|uniref:Uncharacterized protein n=1 Tax=Culex pipiens pipiens TaxID=38569 RepID=A0ABD1CRZ0_CULPP
MNSRWASFCWDSWNASGISQWFPYRRSTLRRIPLSLRVVPCGLVPYRVTLPASDDSAGKGLEHILLDAGLLRKLFGSNATGVTELEMRTDIVLVNSDFSMDYYQMHPPNVISVGGLHIARSYHQRAVTRSKQFRNQPQPPLDRALFWIEQVLEHKGLPHLRSPLTPLYQQYRLAVAVAPFVILAF